MENLGKETCWIFSVYDEKTPYSRMGIDDVIWIKEM